MTITLIVSALVVWTLVSIVVGVKLGRFLKNNDKRFYS